jgi:hypothetical protein
MFRRVVGLDGAKDRGRIKCKFPDHQGFGEDDYLCPVCEAARRNFHCGLLGLWAVVACWFLDLSPVYRWKGTRWMRSRLSWLRSGDLFCIQTGAGLFQGKATNNPVLLLPGCGMNNESSPCWMIEGEVGEVENWSNHR